MFRTVSLISSFLLWIVVVLSSCNSNNAVLPYYNTPDFTPLFVNDPKIVRDSITHIIGDFSFTDQDGITITQRDIEGKIHIANFIFTSCGSICPVMTKHLKKLDDIYKQDSNILILSYTVTPWIDSVPVLKSFKQHHDITNPNWHFLTGSKTDIYQLARTSYFAEEDLGFTKDSTEFLHTEHILLVDKTKRIRGIYNGTLRLDIEQLIKDIKLLSKE